VALTSGIGSCAMVSPWTGRNTQNESTLKRSVKPSTPGEGCGQAATSSRGYIEYASGRPEFRPIARTTLTLIRAPSASRLVYIDSVYRHVAPNHLIIVGKAPATITASGRVSIFEEDSDAHSGFGDFDDCDGFGRAVGSRADV